MVYHFQIAHKLCLILVLVQFLLKTLSYMKSYVTYNKGQLTKNIDNGGKMQFIITNIIF